MKDEIDKETANYNLEQLRKLQDLIQQRQIGSHARKRIELNTTPERKAEVERNLKLATLKARMPKPKPKPKTFKPKPYNLMLYKDAARIFWTKYLNKEGGFVVDENNKSIISAMVKWAIRDTSLGIENLEKGFFLCGSVGCGKSTLMQALSKFTNDLDLCTKFNFITEEAMRKEIKQTSGDAFHTRLTSGSWCYDDMGTNPKLKIYGDDMHLVNDLIKARYNKWQGNKIVTHGTSNFTAKDFDQDTTEYDYRSIDRLKQMCMVVFLKGKSRR